MSARRIARELAVILMPQLPKDRHKLNNIDYEALIAKSVHMLVDHAKQCLSNADAILVASTSAITDIENNHPINSQAVEEVQPVPLTSAQLKEQISTIERALELVSEALDIPEMALHSGRDQVEVKCRNCDHVSTTHVNRINHSEVRNFIVALVGTYIEHREQVDQFIKGAKAKWQIDRMVSIDRDILRLACTEAFFMSEIPINVCISEAVELCHRFADQKAARFINGILGELSDEAKYFRFHGKLKDPSEASETLEADSAESART